MTTTAAAPGVMPLAAHASEARVRMMRAAVAIVVGIVAGYLLSGQILDLLREPIEQIALSRSASLNYDSVTGAFDLKLKISIVAGAVLSSPVWLYELFTLAAPGLTKGERVYTFGYAGTAIVLFGAGCAFGIALFPRMVELLTSFASEDESTILNAGYYVDFVLKLLVATGIAFVLPVFLVMLNALESARPRAVRKAGDPVFGLTFEKLLVVIDIAAIVIGPAQLPDYAQRLAHLVRSFRG